MSKVVKHWESLELQASNLKKTGRSCPKRNVDESEIRFVWNGYEGHWDTMLRALTQFKQREGHCNVFEQHIEYLDGEVKDNRGLG
jgi:hypothetical protein